MLDREPSIRLDRPLCYSVTPSVPMDAKKTRQGAPKIPFRVLIVGKANAGKTTILQRVCETTESPVIYRGKGRDREEVRGPKYSSTGLILLSPTRLKNLTRQSMLVTMSLYFGCFSLTRNQRSEHKIDDELVFSNHTGYVFHDSMGIEAASVDELEIFKDFIRRKCGEKKLRDKLHAIWFGLPFHDYESSRSCFEVLHPNGQVPTRARSKILPQHLL